MSDPFWLSDAQMARLEPCFPKSNGKPRFKCPTGHFAAMPREVDRTKIGMSAKLYAISGLQWRRGIRACIR